MQQSPKSAKKPPKARKPPQLKVSLSGQQIAAVRKSLQLSQRMLADRLGKSQSWIRDIENGRLQLNEKDCAMLSELLS